jgi:hypothetical protein
MASNAVSSTEQSASEAEDMDDALTCRTDWSSFWDITDPETASTLMIYSFGAMAGPAAENCEIAASLDGRGEDCRFWTEVRKRVEEIQFARRQKALALWKMSGLSEI